MDLSETVKKILQEVIVPELGKIKDENSKILAVLEVTNKRLDDMNAHLADQSRRIDETNKRIDETNQRVDELRSDFIAQIDETNRRVDELRSDLTTRIEDVRSDLTTRMDGIHSDLFSRLDGNNARIDRFFLTSATKEEHGRVDERLTHLEREMDNLKQRLAA